MTDIPDGGQVEMKGSGAKPYVLKNVGGVYSCSCPAWRNQSVGLERRTCKHLRKLRGEAAEAARVGGGAVEARPKLGEAEGAAEGGADEAAGPPLLLAHPWENDVDLTGWWMSEKLDGVRAYWDGTSFWSRQGNAFLAPAWFTERLPKTPLDGELFGGRQRFQRTVSVVRRQDRSEDWRELVFVVFDVPASPAPFEARLEDLRRVVEEAQSPYVKWHPHERCRDTGHLREELARVEALGGEGLMLRQPGSLYEAGRSPTLLKVKRFHDDEARVVAHVAGKGRHKGRLGALEVELRDGTRFSVGTGFSDAERAAPPPPGTIITFRYQELSRDGVPRFPSYVGVRVDAAPFPAAGKAAGKAAR
jgi:DNA ligase-1